ncbi:MAG: hypothetical protein GY849_12675, partial [Deltaproteobacteria bacterium]|nr:hypothetical protein [Deltaproteobacteria bacterium]
KGVWIKGRELGHFLLRESDDFRAGCEALRVDGQEADLDRLSHVKWTEKRVFVRVRSR